MYDDLGPQSRRVYTSLREDIMRGEYPSGSVLPSYMTLAVQFGVAAMTVRKALAQLEHDGLIILRQGRGTYVQIPSPPAVLIVDDDPEMRDVLRRHTNAAGYRGLDVESGEAALAVLEGERAVGLVISDVRMPDTADGIAFIRAVHRRWPALPLAAVTGYPDDLAELHGTAEYPVLILTKPVRQEQLLEIFRYTLGTVRS